MSEPAKAESLRPPEVPPTPTLANVAEPETFSLKGFRAVKSGEKTAAEVIAEQPDEPLPTTETPEPEPQPGRARDEQGRFVAKPDKTPEPVLPVTVTPPAPGASLAEDDDETKPPRDVSAFERRLAKERKRRGDVERQAQADRERLERELAEIRAKLPKEAPSAPVPPAAAAFPSYEEYLADHPEASYETYIDARADARAEQRAAALVEQRLTADRQRLEVESTDRAVSAALQQITTQGPKTHADFEAVLHATVDAGLQLAPHVTNFLIRGTETLDEAVALTYRLFRDHELLRRVNAMPPVRAHYELGKIMTSPPVSAPGPEPVVPPVTKAPAPTRPVVGSASVSPTVADVVSGSSGFSLDRYRSVKAQGRT